MHLNRLTAWGWKFTDLFGIILLGKSEFAEENAYEIQRNAYCC